MNYEITLLFQNTEKIIKTFQMMSNLAIGRVQRKGFNCHNWILSLSIQKFCDSQQSFSTKEVKCRVYQSPEMPFQFTLSLFSMGLTFFSRFWHILPMGHHGLNMPLWSIVTYILGCMSWILTWKKGWEAVLPSPHPHLPAILLNSVPRSSGIHEVRDGSLKAMLIIF